MHRVWCSNGTAAPRQSLVLIDKAPAGEWSWGFFLEQTSKFSQVTGYPTHQASCDVETTIYFLRLRARNDAFAKLVPMMEGPLALRAANISASRRLLHTPPSPLLQSNLPVEAFVNRL